MVRRHLKESYYGGLTIESVVDLFIDSCIVEIYSTDDNTVVFKGWSDEIDSDLLDAEIQSIDNVDKSHPIITFNI